MINRMYVSGFFLLLVLTSKMIVLMFVFKYAKFLNYDMFHCMVLEEH